MDNPVFERRFLTVDDAVRMVELGVLAETEPVELLNGELIVVSPQGPLHRSLTVLVRHALERAFGDDFHVQDHSPVVAGEHNLPEPDCAVIRGEPTDYLDALPNGADVAVAVELSVTSQALDRAKATIYAAAGVACYVQVDVPARRANVYSDPRVGRAEYARVAHLIDGEDFDINGVRLAVSDLLSPHR